MGQNPDWTISQLYEKAWELVKKNRVLWVFGMAMAGLGFGSSSNFNFDSADLESIKKIFNAPGKEQGAEQVWGVASSNLSLLVSQIFSLIPPFFYIIFTLEIVILIIMWIVLSLISSAWTNASLISGIQTAFDGQTPTIRDSSERAFPKIKPLIWLQIVPVLVFIIISILVFGILGLGLALGPDFLKIIFGISLFITVILFVYAAIMLLLTQIWAPREVVLNQKSGRNALASGYKMAKKKRGAMLLLGLVNTILSGIIIGIPLMLIFGLLLGRTFSFSGNQNLGIVLLVFGGLLMLVFIFGGLIVSGILTAFKAAVWTIAYNNIKGKYDQ